LTGERRRSPRYMVRDVHGTLLFVAEGRVLDMSLTGMSVETDTRLRLNRTYSLRLRNDDGFEVPLAATVVWCQLRQTQSTTPSGTVVYVAGLRFEDVLSEKAERLISFLESAAVISVETRLCGRFRACFREAIDLKTEYEFEVRSISASGMLIVTELAAQQGSLFEMELNLESYPLRVLGRAAHVRTLPRQVGPPKEELGVEFVDLMDTDRSALLEFVGRHLS
jgi:hypothetical protein